ncbi:hypothetical protein [Desulfobacula sp.]|uniref:hypothetical protein n=1 Tax=Desulfobacula sp. TaxID=2593537 RepID=UPI00261EB6C1|nr:hypothetical protein [Desulfobacula sp.]
MQIRYIIILLGILVSTHLAVYGLNGKTAVKALQARILAFDTQIHQLKSHKISAERKLKRLTAVAKSLKPWLNTGFQDPEQGFVKFLDFLTPELLKEVNSKVTLRGSPTFQNSPIPLQKTSFQIAFDFRYPNEAERFLKEFLLQNDYPLKVNSAAVQRAEGQRTRGAINVDLLLPASLLKLNLDDLKGMGV